MEQRSRVLVVGAGVVGLSCAVRLLEAGHRVDVVARDLPLETTSAVAAALWYPYLVQPRDGALAWSRTSYEVFAGLAQEEPDSGVRMLPGAELFAAAASGRHRDPWWREAVPALERATDLSALPTGAGIVVNCSGLGGRLLGQDPSVVPVAGQVLYVEQWGLDRWWLDASGPTYVVPRSRDVVVGGTEVEGEWSRTPSPVVAEDILRRASRLVPDLAGKRVLRHKVGLRPVRAETRVERVGDVVHCYGQGGAGVTLSWGVADEVTALVAGATQSGTTSTTAARSIGP
jgi:D-amino-acid oxidase